LRQPSKARLPPSLPKLIKHLGRLWTTSLGLAAILLTASMQPGMLVVAGLGCQPALSHVQLVGMIASFFFRPCFI